VEESKEELTLRPIHEAFLIGVLQAVSGGSVMAALSQADRLVSLLATGWLLLFVTAMGVGVIAAVLAALWHVKATVRGSRQEYMSSIRMRLSMYVACCAIVVGMVSLLAGLWVMFFFPGDAI